MNITEKLKILSDAAKYDVSCSSSGSNRQNTTTGIGNAAHSGICHSFTPDGRCISLLKILMTNVCSYDCAYCVNRKSNDIPRATFTIDEIVDLTMNFYRRNYIEGLFLSSAIIHNPNDTMERLTLIVEKLRLEKKFNGYIHLKAIPGASQELIHRAGCQVDRMSVNIELPSSQSLQRLAPEKSKIDVLTPMHQIHTGILQQQSEKKQFYQIRKYVPAGQTTQMIVGASEESDLEIMTLTSHLYHKFSLKRVYFSAYVPVNIDQKLPSLLQPPKIRENRLYQADWLLRYYGFQANELLHKERPNFHLDYDPKTIWAIDNIHLFPIEINTASYEQLLRIPGMGVRGAQRVFSARKIRPLDFTDLKKMNLSVKRIQHFITCKGRYYATTNCNPNSILHALRPKHVTSPHIGYEQLTLFDQQMALSGQL